MNIILLFILLAFTVVCSAQNVSFSVLYSFTNLPDGQNPDGCIVEGSDGALYGTTDYGGTNYAGGFGTVFKINKSGSGYTNLVRFGQNIAGYNSNGGLIRASNGVIYGVTEGGSQNYGTIFKLNGDGSGFAVAYNFATAINDVGFPEGHLVQGLDGGLYGVSAASGSTGYGTIYRYDPVSGGHSVLYSFTNFSLFGNGSLVSAAGLVQGRDGKLYGTTYSSSMPDGSGGWVFTVNTNGTGFKILFVLTNSPPDYANPQANLIQGSDGMLYGTTTGGGDSHGSIFKIQTNGTGYTVLHRPLTTTEDRNPLAGLLQGSDGALYGTTVRGGVNDSGTIFRINPDGSGYSILYGFSNTSGISPRSSVIQGSDGALYGTAYGGGSYSNGTVYRLAVAPQLGIALSTNGVPKITLAGLAGQACQIQTSTNFTAWVTLTNFVISTNSLNQFTDFSATNFIQRYYRASTQ